jgi:hypothetical protein
MSVMLKVFPGAAKEEPMPSGSAKQKVLEVIEKLPPDATLEDAIERLVLLAKTERGLAELDAGRGVDHDEASVDFSGDPGRLGASGPPRRRGDTCPCRAGFRSLC